MASNEKPISDASKAPVAAPKALPAKAEQ